MRGHGQLMDKLFMDPGQLMNRLCVMRGLGQLMNKLYRDPDQLMNRLCYEGSWSANV